MPQLSYQLYCSRNNPPIGDTLKMLATAGYREVEGYGGLFDDVATLKAALDETGLRMTSSHIGLDMIESDPSGTLEIIKTLGIEKVFAPYVAEEDRPKDSAGWAAFGKRLAAAGKPLQDAGVIFGWHNHDFEFGPTATGDMPIDLIAAGADDLMLELDLGWVGRSGQDSVAWINKYAGRITAAHVKDIAPAGECTDEDGWADVGHGTMDWAAIHAALQATGVTHYVAEHDNPSDDKRFATRSLTAMQSF
jgi:sugar phosphate isomerase/epimerase